MSTSVGASVMSVNAAREFVLKTIRDDLGLAIKDVSKIPLKWEPDLPFPFTHYPFEVELEGDLAECSSLPRLGGTTSPPKGTFRVVFRITNSVNNPGQNESRIENEVAAMQIARDSLSHRSLGHLIPNVYTWAPTANGAVGWILMEHKPGDWYCLALDDRTLPDRKPIIDQVAAAFTAIQQAQLPPTIKTYGGLRFDQDGNIEGGPMTDIPADPKSSYTNLLRARLRYKLQQGQQRGVLTLPETSALAQRVDAFIESPKLADAVDDTALTNKTLVHGDFSRTNLLIDMESLQLTALLDFDSSYIGSRMDEFCFQMPQLHRHLLSAYKEDGVANTKAIIDAFLTGVWDKPTGEKPTTRDEVLQEEAWTVSKMFYTGLEAAGAELPNHFKKSAQLYALWDFGQKLCPGWITFEPYMKTRTPEQIARDIKNAEGEIEKALKVFE